MMMHGLANPKFHHQISRESVVKNYAQPFWVVRLSAITGYEPNRSAVRTFSATISVNFI